MSDGVHGRLVSCDWGNKEGESTFGVFFVSRNTLEIFLPECIEEMRDTLKEYHVCIDVKKEVLTIYRTLPISDQREAIDKLKETLSNDFGVYVKELYLPNQELLENVFRKPTH